MRTFRLLTFFISIVVAAISVSCQQDAPIDKPSATTSVEFAELGEKLVVEIDSEGGEVSVNYVINNGIEGIDIVAATDV